MFLRASILRQIAQKYAEKSFLKGRIVSFCETPEDIPRITAKRLTECAYAGSRDAVGILRECGKNFGRGLAVLIDVLNPECIVVGGIFSRAKPFLYEPMMREIRKEALPASVAACRVEAAGLGERIGDYAAIVACPAVSAAGEQER